MSWVPMTVYKREQEARQAEKDLDVALDALRSEMEEASDIQRQLQEATEQLLALVPTDDVRLPMTAHCAECKWDRCNATGKCAAGCGTVDKYKRNAKGDCADFEQRALAERSGPPPKWFWPAVGGMTAVTILRGIWDLVLGTL